MYLRQLLGSRAWSGLGPTQDDPTHKEKHFLPDPTTQETMKKAHFFFNLNVGSSFKSVVKSQ